MAEHYITICKRCKKVISQCPCDSKDKALIEVTCGCKKTEMNDEVNVMKNIEKECLCSCCHSGAQIIRCTCTKKCKTLANFKTLANLRIIALQYANTNISHEALAWLTCAELAEEIDLSRTAWICRKIAITVYEEIGCFHGAKNWSEIFGLTELVKYYQKLIDLRASRPK